MCVCMCKALYYVCVYVYMYYTNVTTASHLLSNLSTTYNKVHWNAKWNGHCWARPKFGSNNYHAASNSIEFFIKISPTHALLFPWISMNFTHSHTHSLSQLILLVPTPHHSLTPSLPHSLTHSLSLHHHHGPPLPPLSPPSLPHPLPHPLPHSLTPSLTHPLTPTP